MVAFCLIAYIFIIITMMVISSKSDWPGGDEAMVVVSSFLWPLTLFVLLAVAFGRAIHTWVNG